MKNFQEYLNGEITEQSLSRLLSHADGNFFMISANRAGNNASQNRKQNGKLLSDLNSMKMGPQKVIGYWQECSITDVEYKDCPKDKLVSVEEDSFFVPIPEDMKRDEYLKVVKDLTKKYDQDATLLKDDNGLQLVFRNGSTEKIGSGTVSVGKVAQAYSKLTGKKDVPFTFE